MNIKSVSETEKQNKTNRKKSQAWKPNMLNSVDTPLLKETPQKDDISNINGIVKRNLIEKKNWVHNFVKT